MIKYSLNYRYFNVFCSLSAIHPNKFQGSMTESRNGSVGRELGGLLIQPPGHGFSTMSQDVVWSLQSSPYLRVIQIVLNLQPFIEWLFEVKMALKRATWPFFTLTNIAVLWSKFRPLGNWFIYRTVTGSGVTWSSLVTFWQAKSAAGNQNHLTLLLTQQLRQESKMEQNSLCLA